MINGLAAAVDRTLGPAPGRRGRYHMLVYNYDDEVTLSLDTDVKFTEEHFYGAGGSLPDITLLSSQAYLVSQAGESR